MDRVPPALVPQLDADVPADGLTIGEAAAVVGLSVETLRYYEREGLLLDPAARRSNGHRRFRRADLDWLAGLVMLRETGMPIARIREIAAISRTPGSERERLEVLQTHRDAVVARLEQTRRHLVALDTKIAAYRAYVGDEEDAIHDD
ncbi:MerR family transcriptional regulator [Agromyces silvae]|uniref:MerR family transcriptional regulator n=1 Tax=Agromyces silvae TaxID=3388266 RepID=UPI00280B8F95|nr:MerR family transcriptional regulator [Agromyces protaetiae]